MSHAGAWSQGFGPSSTAFPGHEQGAGWDVELPGLELAPIWDLGTCKVRTLATRLLRQAHLLQLFFFKDLFLLFFHWKGGYTEKRDRDREEDLPSDDSLPK